MSRMWILAALLFNACAKGPQADLPSIGQARSLAAEWALVNDQAARGRLRVTYVETMRSELRKELQTTATSLKLPNSPYGAEIRALLDEPGDAPADLLRSHVDKLKQIEDQLESA